MQKNKYKTVYVFCYSRTLFGIILLEIFKKINCEENETLVVGAKTFSTNNAPRNK